MKTKYCENCGVAFPPYPRWAKRRFCSLTCSRQGMRGERRSSFGKERVSLAERFWSKVDKNGPIPSHCPEIGPCWLWTGAKRGPKDDRGYLGKTRGMPTIGAACLSYEMHVGPVPDGLYVLHRCDLAECVNWEHLFVGTQAENMLDMTRKGRRVTADHHGKNNPNATLSVEKVAFVHQLRAEGWSQQRIANEVGVGQSQISRILLGQAWKVEG